MHARVHDGTWPTAPGWSAPWSPHDLLQLLIWASFRLLSKPRNSLFLPPIHVCVPPSRPSAAIRVPENPQVPGPVQPSALTTCKPLWCSLSLPSTGGVGVCVLLPEAECESSLSELLVHLLRSLPVSGPTPPRCLCRHHNYQLRVGSTQSPPVTTLGPGATLPRQRRRTTGAWPWGSLVSPCLPSSRTSGQNACKQSHQLGTTPRSARAPSSEGGMPGTNVPDGRVHTHWRASSGRRVRGWPPLLTEVASVAAGPPGEWPGWQGRKACQPGLRRLQAETNSSVGTPCRGTNRRGRAAARQGPYRFPGAASLAQSRSRPEPGLPGALLGAETPKHGHGHLQRPQPGKGMATRAFQGRVQSVCAASGHLDQQRRRRLRNADSGLLPNLWIQSCLQVTRTRPGGGAC